MIEGDALTKVRYELKKYDTNKDDQICLSEFQMMMAKDKDAIELLDIFGVMTQEDDQEINGFDENDLDDNDDLQNELNVKNNEVDERAERIKSGIEHLDEDDDILGQAKESQGDEKLATNAWVGAVKASKPSDYKPQKGF